MSEQDLLNTQTCILRVNIDCDGCKRKFRKILQKIDGVYATTIDMQQGKVTVTGDVEPDVLIKKLEKSGKHAELWSTGKGENKNKNGELDNVNDQLNKLLQMGDGKGGGNEAMKAKGGKDQQKGGVIGGGDGKNVQQVNFQQLLEQMRSGSKDFTKKDQKPVKVDLPSEGGGDDDFGDFSGDEFDDDEFDEDDDYDDDEFDEDDYDDDDEGDQHHNQQKTAMPIMVDGLGKDKKGGGGGGGEKAEKGSGDGGEKAKKGSGIMSMMGKVIGGSNEGKKCDGLKNGGEGTNGNEGKKGGGPKNEGEGKNGNKSGGGGGGGGKKGGFQDLDVPNHTKGGGGGMGPVGQYQVGPMGQQFPGAPVMNMNGGGGGYYQGMGPMGPVPGNSYQQQQYMAVMNQQMMMLGGGGAYHPAMYGRPPPGYGYTPPPVYHDHITHIFSDENPGSCSIM